MKVIIYASLIFSFLTFFSCRKIKDVSTTVVKDCTGTYIRYEGKDYHVCNPAKTNGFADGAAVSVTFRKVNSCSAADSIIVCMMLHENEGWIEVEEIK